MIPRPATEPPAVVSQLTEQLPRLQTVEQCEKLLRAEIEDEARVTVIRRVLARRRALGGEGYVPPYRARRADSGLVWQVVDAIGQVRATASEDGAWKKADLWNREAENGAEPSGGEGDNGREGTPPALSPASVETPEDTRAEGGLPDGLHEDVQFSNYLKIDAASNTALGWLARSPAHLRAYMEEPPTFVDPDSIGSALHALVLEGEEAFRRRYRRAPDEADHKGRKPWKEFVEALPDRVIPMKATDYDTVVEMASRVMDHPAARLALGDARHAESTALWTDEETGVRCKARFDALAPEIGAVVDLKSTTDASEYAFSRSIYNYSYHRQGGWYQHGASLVVPDVEWRHHVIVAQEKAAPYAVAVYRIQDAALVAGRDECRQLLARYAECVERDEWPGYDERFIEIDLPPWGWKRIEEEVYD